MNVLTGFLAIIIVLPQPILFKYRFFIWAVLGIGFICSYITKRRFKIAYFLNSLQDICFLLYIFTLSLGCIFAINKNIALPAYINFLIPSALIYYIFKNKPGDFNQDFFAYIFVSLSCAVSILAISEIVLHRNIIYEHFVYNDFYQRYVGKRAMSTFMAPAVLGTYLLGCAPFSFYLICGTKKRNVKIFAATAFIAAFTAMFLTFSRGAFIGFTVMACFYFYNRYKNKLVFFVPVILLVFTVILGSLPLSSHINSRLSWKGISAEYIYTYKASRAITTFRILEKHPFTGVGPDNYRDVFDRYHFLKDTPYEWKIPDNMFMMILGETGILGFLGFIIFLGVLFIRGFKYFIAPPKGTEKYFLLSAMAALLGITFNMLTYDLLYWHTPFYLFWIFSGLMVSYGYREGDC